MLSEEEFGAFIDRAVENRSKALTALETEYDPSPALVAPERANAYATLYLGDMLAAIFAAIPAGEHPAGRSREVEGNMIREALEGDSNDAEHDALVAIAEALGIRWTAPDVTA